MTGDQAFVEALEAEMPERDSLKLVKTRAAGYAKEHPAGECYATALACYQSENFQVQEVGVFLMGAAAGHVPEALTFLHDVVSGHESWKVQETLAMAFDDHCRREGYEKTMPLVRAWLGDERPNIRRAASEGLRVWTSRPYWKDHPEEAVALLAGLREDESDYVRRSAGNAIKDISKKHGELVRRELSTWDMSSKRVQQVYRLASKHLD